MWYRKTEGDSFHASFRLQCPSGWSTDQGFTASKGHEYSYVFKIGNKGAWYGWFLQFGLGSPVSGRTGEFLAEDSNRQVRAAICGL